ncbi:MAG: PRC-barrel domain-containing protein [Candidatus Syntropharchaeales archaeon]|nr:PRC-barrel domain-containing protein [Candidatus Syntrophoarchaeum sp.]
MSVVYTRGLYGKNVVATDGTEVGELVNILADMRTGELISIVVKPDISFDTGGYEMDDGFILIPFRAVKAAKDVITVDKSQIGYPSEDIASIEV